MNSYELLVSPADAVHAAQLGLGHHPHSHTGASGFYPAFDPYAGAQEMSGATTTGDLQTQLATVGGLMDATDAAVNGCSALPSSDVAAWQGVYRGWGTFRDALTPCVAGMPPGDTTPPSMACISLAGGLNWNGAAAKLASFQQTANAYSQRVHNSCPNFNPPPSPSPSGGGGQPCAWFDRALGRCSQQTDESWAPAAKWIAIAGIVAIAAWAVGPLVAALAGAAATHVGGGKHELEEW